MFKIFSSVSLIVLSLIPITAVASENHYKGSIYAFWGWNRAEYSDSDVTFTGDDYEFTIKDMTASDRQTTVGLDPYLNPVGITLPQTNFKVGYFIEDNISLSFGVDHMKYVMDQDQTATVDGIINVGSTYDGTYDDQEVDLSQDGFLSYEHTDGLNYINLEANLFHDLYSFSPSITISGLVGAGAGILMPKTNATLLTYDRHDDFHISGWGTHIKAGIEINYERYFTRSELKYGYIDMPDIRTTSSSSDSASQHFTFTELNFLLGVYF